MNPAFFQQIERILHWRDLDSRHQAIFEIIAWMSPELRDLAVTLDRFQPLRRSGLTPWLEKLRRHWPESPAAPAHTTESIATVEANRAPG